MAASSEDRLQAHETSLWRDQLLHRLAGHSLPPSSLGDRGGWDRFMPSVPRSSSPVKIPEGKPGPMAEFFCLRQRVLRLTLSVTIVAGLLAGLVWDLQTCFSLLAGAAAGILYLLLLSRSVERLGKRSNKLGKAHLAAPVLLFILALRLQGLDFLPAFFGFLLYKPAILLIAFSDLTGSNEPKIFVSGSPSA
ncbi:ATP synthase subunit I [Candidatus Synechococcus spongiarum]|nr:ATP synthase subunit I [Candidatus Synechococcus spongiarum]